MLIKQKIPKRSYSGINWMTNKANKKRLIIDFEHKCAYCDDLDKYGGGSKMYHVEHFAPKEKFPELQYTYDNLLYACPYCNISKSNKWVSDKYDVNVIENRGFIDPCTPEYYLHLERRENGEIGYCSPLGKYIYFELKLYLDRHQLIYNLERIHLKIKELKKEIENQKKNNRDVTKLETVLKDLCTIFFDYYDIFSEYEEE